MGADRRAEIVSDPRVRGVPPQSQPASKVYDVVGVRPRETLRLLLLGDVVDGYLHHWVKDERYPNGRSRVCTYMDGECQHHGQGHEVWLGYIAALDMARKKRVVLRVGAECATAILAHCGRLVSLRGAHLSLTAEHDGEAMRAVVESLHEISLQPIPLAHDISETLRVILGVRRLPSAGPRAEELADSGPEVAK